MSSNTFKRFLQQTEECYFLFGPRGTGKTTWLKMNYPEALYIDLLSTSAFISYSANPERLRELIAGNPNKKVVIIGEVQRVPSILTIVHQIIEEKKGIQFILTGSSSRKLKQTGVDLLAGRALLRKCHPFMACELGESYDFEKSLQIGMLPVVLGSKNSLDVLNTYVSLYLREEIQNEGLIRNIGNFARFLESISFSHSTVLNLSDVARDCEVERKTVEGYLNILEDLMLCYRIPVFNKRAKRILISHNKFYFFDSGVFQSIRPKGVLDSVSEISGKSAEGLILQHLIAWNDYSGNKNKIYFWRTKSGVELDFIVYGETEFWAIEVKNSNKIDTRELKGLNSFKEDYPEAKLLFLYRGTEILKKNEILCYPIDLFLKKLNPNKKLLIL
jgi:predicted AAA+ superfamily ATPase